MTTTYRIQIKRGLAAAWTADDPVLAEGELGLETDSLKLKIGDGISPWSALPYLIDALFTDAEKVALDVMIAGQVVSIFGRTGIVVAEADDYTADQITDTASKVLMTPAERTKLASFAAYWLTRLASDPAAVIQSLLNAADLSAAQTVLGVSAFVKTLLDDADAGAARTTLAAAAAAHTHPMADFSDVSAYAKTLLDDADAGAALTTLGLSAYAKTLVDDADAATARTTLGLTAAYDQSLQGAYSNRIINGDMQVDQRYGGGAVLVDNNAFYLLDRWQVSALGAAGNGTLTVQRVANAGARAQKFTVTTVRTSPAAADAYGPFHWIEGNQIADLLLGTASARTFTVSFKVKASIAGTYVLSVGNGATDRCYPVAFTIDQANVEESKTITIPGDTSGTWDTDTGKGMFVRFDLGSGANYETATLGAWQAGNLGTTAAAVKLCRNAGATFQITDVQLLPGSAALPFQRRPLGQELALCQRYYEHGNTIYAGAVSNGFTCQVTVPFAVEKRAAPTIGGADGGNASFPAGIPSVAADVPATRSFRAYKVPNATAAGYFIFAWTADAELY